MSKPYNGYKNWTHWNVSLWINNDDGAIVDCFVDLEPDCLEP